MTERRVIISGGGTGGHLYPALVVGRKLRDIDAGISLTYVGTHRDVEKKIMENHEVDFIPMKIEGLKGRGLRSLKALAILPWSFVTAFRILRRTKPALVIGVGGYSSGPIVLIAAWLGIPTLILEPNAYPGYTNRLLARWVRKAVVAFDSTLPHFKNKGIRLGNPVREGFTQQPRKTRTADLSVLVFGGSQGSHFLNETVTAALPLLAGHKARLRLTHQTGLHDLDWVSERYRSAGFAESEVAAYLMDMPRYFAQADLTVSRAGATTLAETIAARKAAILVPFAGASEDHQTRNAHELEAAAAADVIPESRLTPEVLARRILHYLGHPEELDAMERNLIAFGSENAAEKIARLCLDLLTEKAQEKRP